MFGLHGQKIINGREDIPDPEFPLSVFQHIGDLARIGSVRIDAPQMQMRHGAVHPDDRLDHLINDRSVSDIDPFGMFFVVPGTGIVGPADRGDQDQPGMFQIFPGKRGQSQGGETAVESEFRTMQGDLLSRLEPAVDRMVFAVSIQP